MRESVFSSEFVKSVYQSLIEEREGLTMSAFKDAVKIAVVAVCVTALTAGSVGASGGGKFFEKFRGRGIRNVIVMIPDGCDQSVLTAARWYKKYVQGDDEPLALDKMGVTGMVKTYMANSVVTGSAAAGTAFATGHKTTVRFLSVGPDPGKASNLTGFGSSISPYAPIMTVLEGAKTRGKAAGLIATSRITHATPAAYGSHIDDRGKDNDIMEHLVYQDIDVVFGGGKRHLLTKDQGGKRTDGEDLLQVLLERGYHFVETADEMAAVTRGRVWGLFAASHMEADIDRAEFASTQPSLAEMTGKAIDLLSHNRRGFFLMVEGSQVDWAGHANDPIYMITDFLAFDAAVAKVMEYADRHPNTLVMVFPDHNTGAMSIGHEQSSFPPGYTATTVEDLLDPLRGMKITSTGLARKLGKVSDSTIASVKNTVSEWWGLEITDDDAAMILTFEYKDEDVFDAYPISEYISKHYTVFGWTTHGHSGEDVPLWSYGRNRPVGLFDNTELAEVVASAFNFDLKGSGMWIEYPDTVLDTKNIDANPVATIDGARYPVSKDIMIDDGVSKDLLGITVYAPESGKVYIPIE
jgi:alkaline phosphatase